MARTFERPDVGPESKATFRTIHIGSIRLDTVCDFDLYTTPQGRPEPVLYRKRNLPFTEEVKQRLVDHRVTELQVPMSQQKAYTAYCEANLSGILSDSSIGVAEKMEVLYDTAHSVVHEFMEDPRSGEVIPRSESLVSNAINFMFENESSFSHFLEASSFDYYTYTHSVNVFVYTITLAERLGHEDEAFLKELGTGALLHDIGKSKVPMDIINCKGRLSDEQWGIMKQHPMWGYEILTDHGITSEVILAVTLQHHEKLCGGGYPSGIKGDRVSPHARISTVCDIFDALTTSRSYKNALDSFPAFRLMQKEMSEELDPNVFTTFVQMMASTGALASTS